MIASDDNLSPRTAFLFDQLAAAMVAQIETHLESAAGYEGYLDAYFAENPTLIDDIIELCLLETPTT